MTHTQLKSNLLPGTPSHYTLSMHSTPKSHAWCYLGLWIYWIAKGSIPSLLVVTEWSMLPAIVEPSEPLSHPWAWQLETKARQFPDQPPTQTNGIDQSLNKRPTRRTISPGILFSTGIPPSWYGAQQGSGLRNGPFISRSALQDSTYQMKILAGWTSWISYLVSIWMSVFLPIFSCLWVSQCRMCLCNVVCKILVCFGVFVLQQNIVSQVQYKTIGN